MSNYALGAGLQGFVQGATDFFKMYMTFQQMQAEKNYKDKLLNLQERETNIVEKKYQDSIQNKKQLEKILGSLSQKESLTPQDYVETGLRTLPYDASVGKALLSAVPKEKTPKYEIKEIGDIQDETGQWYKQIAVYENGKKVGVDRYPISQKNEKISPIEYANNLIKAGNSLFKMAKDQVAKLTGDQIVLDPKALNNAQQFDLYVSQLQSLKTGGKNPQKDMYINQVIQNMTKAFQYVQLGSDLLARHSMEGLGFNINKPSPFPKPKPSSDNFYLNILKEIQKRNLEREKPKTSTVRKSYEEKKNALLENLKNKQNLFSLF